MKKGLRFEGGEESGKKQGFEMKGEGHLLDLARGCDCEEVFE